MVVAWQPEGGGLDISKAASLIGGWLFEKHVHAIVHVQASKKMCVKHFQAGSEDEHVDSAFPHQERNKSRETFPWFSKLHFFPGGKIPP